MSRIIVLGILGERRLFLRELGDARESPASTGAIVFPEGPSLRIAMKAYNQSGLSIVSTSPRTFVIANFSPRAYFVPPMSPFTPTRSHRETTKTRIRLPRSETSEHIAEHAVHAERAYRRFGRFRNRTENRPNPQAPVGRPSYI